MVSLGTFRTKHFYLLSLIRFFGSFKGQTNHFLTRFCIGANPKDISFIVNREWNSGYKRVEPKVVGAAARDRV